VIVPFPQAFAQLTAQQYVQDFLVATFKPAVLVIGYDHRFGHNRQGNYQLLEALQPHFGYRLVEIPAAVLDNITVSSTQIRRALINCQIEAANELLGYPYFFTGTVVQGNKLGRTLGYPTANLQLPDLEKLLPGNGVYAVKASLPQQPASPQLQGMMNIGVRPTVDGKRLVVEVNLFNFNQDIYHQPMQVAVWHYLRGEQKFEGLEALKRQLGVDKEAALAKLG
ncbi:MAG TPA: riboflavin biosynthesis protein RibF, partial [Phnomibacter sp.]|nr:riboflavin biosynthesis protein RibF [Phnomibacter sp.]